MATTPPLTPIRHLRERLLALAERRLPALTRLRRPEPLPIRLHRRRIYVVPTRFGLAFAAMLLVMLLGALNYNNNAALLLTCLLGAAAFQSVFGAFRALDGLELAAVHAEPCFAGESLSVQLRFAASSRVRRGLRLDVRGRVLRFDLRYGDADPLALDLPTQQRGRYRLPRLRLGSDHPYGWFWAWSWLHPAIEIIVYPRPEAARPPLPEAGNPTGHAARQRAGDEFVDLREYRRGDPLRQIAWKPSARLDELLVREPERVAGHDLHFDWHALTALDTEARIARLARWVCEAEAQQRRYTLQLPGERLGPALGPAHRHACLAALALL